MVMMKSRHANAILNHRSRRQMKATVTSLHVAVEGKKGEPPR